MCTSHYQNGREDFNWKAGNRQLLLSEMDIQILKKITTQEIIETKTYRALQSR